MSDAVAVPPEETVAEEPQIPTRRLLVFEIAGNGYACEMDAFREIVPNQEMTRLPGAPDTVCGLINLRGTIVTVIDGGTALGKPAFKRADGLILLVDYVERLLGFGCVRAHWPDVGSATPGSYGAVTEIYGEGLRLPPVRLYRDGEPDPNIEAIIFANVRTPAERRGDLRAQVAANRRAQTRLEALARKYGADALCEIMWSTEKAGGVRGSMTNGPP